MLDVIKRCESKQIEETGDLETNIPKLLPRLINERVDHGKHVLKSSNSAIVTFEGNMLSA